MAAAEAAAAIDKKTSARILEILVVIDLSGPHRLLSPIIRWYAASAGRATRRHHPADTCARRQFLTVVRPDIGIAPSAGGATAAAFYFSDGLGGLKTINRQCDIMVTRPTAFAFASAID
jgi:hypothetical protein